MTPTDPYAFVGDPPLGLWRPEADEVHVSVTFTWDIEKGQRLAEAWGQYYEIVRLGGPAFGDCSSDFIPGRYLHHGVTFTTRGCNNRCPWCLVPEREGQLKEIENFAPGYVIQDNNILQATRSHLINVGSMLNTQRRAAIFSGGIQTSLVDNWVADWFHNLRINSIFLAADTDRSLPALRMAVSKLDFLERNSNKLRCYVMIAYEETIAQATARLEAVWDAGCMPFAQLYQPADHYIKYSREWKALARTWSRPAAMRKMHEGT